MIYHRRTKSPRGITRIEIIVLVVILGAICAILFPGMNRHVGIQRNTGCMQRQQQWAHACLTYAETFQEYPGYSNKIGPAQTRVTWQIRMLPFVDRSDIYDVWSGKKPPANSQSPTPTPYLDIMICPSNPPDTPTCQSSFVANCGGASSTPYAGNGIFVNHFNGTLI